MKKWIFLATVGLLVVIGCKKEHTCTCTIDGTEVPSVWADMREDDAKEACENLDANVKESDPENFCVLDK